MNELLKLLEAREQKHDAFRLAEAAVHERRAESYSAEMNQYDMAHGEALDWFNDTDNLTELLQFLRAHPTKAEPR